MFSLTHASARLTSTMWSGQVCCGADPVGDRHAYPAAFGQVAHQRVRLWTAHADRPCAAGHLQQHRRLAVARQIGAAPDVGQVGAAVWAVVTTLRLLDVRRRDHVGAQGRFRRRAGSARLGRRGYRIRVVRPELLAQPLLQRWAGVLTPRCRITARIAQATAVNASATLPLGPAKSPRRPRRSASSTEADSSSSGTSRLVGQPEREHRHRDVALPGQRAHTVGGVEEFRCRASQRAAGCLGPSRAISRLARACSSRTQHLAGAVAGQFVEHVIFRGTL